MDCFVLSRCGEKDVYPEYSEYINNAVKENYASLKPSDLARITLSVKAYGLDPENIGGKDLISALKSVDYSSQIYMSSITYPLMALNFAEENISAEMLDTMLKTIIAGQQSDGGFTYCTVDMGYGISSDVDTTAMTVQPWLNTIIPTKELKTLLTKPSLISKPNSLMTVLLDMWLGTLKAARAPLR